MKSLALHKPNQPTPVREIFRSKFQHGIRECVRHGFAIEESFGIVWEETLDEICLLDDEKNGLYEELIAWARSLPAKGNPHMMHSVYSPEFRANSSEPLRTAGRGC